MLATAGLLVFVSDVSAWFNYYRPGHSLR